MTIRPLIDTAGGLAYFDGDTAKPLSTWIKDLKGWLKTYGDVEMKLDAGYNNVSIVLNIKKRKVGTLNVQTGKFKAEARGTHRRAASVGQQDRQKRGRAAKSQKRAASR